jgi:stage II sporulation protein D
MPPGGRELGSLSLRPVRLISPVAAALLAWPCLAAADVRVQGHGNGHGIGMSQYGAYGYALKTRHSYRYILAHYYPDTELRRTGAHSVRVLLKQGPELLVADATRLVAPGRSPISLHADRTYRFEPDPAGLRVVDTRAGRTKAHVASPATVSGGASVRLRGRAQNGVMSGRYRGSLVISAGADGLSAVNRLDIEHYLYGVVPSEMPAAWPSQALDAQAVAARSYVLRSRVPAAPFDVYADVRSQVYRGVGAETARSTAAVSSTRREALFYNGAVAATYFSSSSGGRTAAIDEEWGGPPVPYLRSVSDPYDYLSPWHSWTVRMDTAEVEKRLGTLLLGKLQGMSVVARNSSGRAATVEIQGSGGVTEATGARIRAALGLRSTLFTLTFTP